MKRLLFYVVISVFCSVLSINAQSKDTDKPENHTIDPTVIKALKGEWINDLKSTLTISDIDSKTGKITGTYISPSGTAGEVNELTGWVNVLKDSKPGWEVAPPDDKKHIVYVIGFTVRYWKYGSVCTWNGYYDKAVYDSNLHKFVQRPDAPPIIIGQWLLSRAGSQYGYSWEHINAGQDVFRKK